MILSLFEFRLLYSSIKYANGTEMRMAAASRKASASKRSRCGAVQYSCSRLLEGPVRAYVCATAVSTPWQWMRMASVRKRKKNTESSCQIYKKDAKMGMPCARDAAFHLALPVPGLLLRAVLRHGRAHWQHAHGFRVQL